MEIRGKGGDRMKGQIRDVVRRGEQGRGQKQVFFKGRVGVKERMRREEVGMNVVISSPQGFPTR